MTSPAPTSLIGPTNPLPPILTQRVLDMGQATILSETQSFNQSTPTPRLRYFTILLEQGKLGRNIGCVMETCMQAINAHNASNEYIQAVFNYIHDQVQAGKVEEIVGVRETKRLRALVRNGVPTLHPTLAERTALKVILADAYQRLPAHLRRTWQG
jgi:DNA-binding phage protein